jgi:hypothetical protein
MFVVLLSVSIAVVVPFLTWAYNRRRNSFSLLGQLRGPESPSFWIGEHWLRNVKHPILFLFPFFFSSLLPFYATRVD